MLDLCGGCHAQLYAHHGSQGKYHSSRISTEAPDMHLRLSLLALSTLGLAGCEDAPPTAGAQPRTMVAQRALPAVPWGEPCAPPIGEPIVWVDPCPGQVTCALPDLDNDGAVGINDFLLLLKLWGPSDCTLYRKGDINWDGQVDTADMLIILEVWDTYESATWERCDC